MPEGTNNSIVHLGDLSKPADTLIKKISQAVGGMFAPFQVKRMAKAEAEAALIKAESAIEITDLHRRAMHRFINEEAQRQKNIEEITAKALPLLRNKAKPNQIEDDWITNFFEKARIVSDEEMRNLWARILAGEANNPGKFSKRTINLLADMDQGDAEAFTWIVSFSWNFSAGRHGWSKLSPLIYQSNSAIYQSEGIEDNMLDHLSNIGLITFDKRGDANLKDLPKNILAHYFNCSAEITLHGDKDDAKYALRSGHVTFTKSGAEIASICDNAPVGGFLITY